MNMTRRLCGWLLAILLIGPAGARAQCGMGGMGGGHEHHASPEASTKHDKKIRDILSKEETRERLFEILVADDSLLREFLEYAFATPKGLRLGAAMLESGRHEASSVGPRETAPPDSLAPATGFRCPMHPEIVSPSAGSCPTCGMELERIETTESP